MVARHTWHIDHLGTTGAFEAQLHDAREGALLTLEPADASLVLMHMRGQLRWHNVIDGVERRCAPVAAGTACVLDGRHGVALRFSEPAHLVAVRMPHATWGQRGTTASSPRVPQSGWHDDALTYIALSMIEAIRDPVPLDHRLHDHLIEAVVTHFATLRANQPVARQRALSHREIDLLMDAVDQRLASALTVADAADACGLSRDTFERAFRQTVGIAPHQWIILRRLDMAMTLLLTGGQTLQSIADMTGFASQSHLSRSFSRRYGLPPSAWRRLQASRRPRRD